MTSCEEMHVHITNSPAPKTGVGDEVQYLLMVSDRGGGKTAEQCQHQLALAKAPQRELTNHERMCRNLELLQAFDERGDTGPEWSIHTDVSTKITPLASADAELAR